MRFGGCPRRASLVASATEAPVAQLDRALASGARGCRFESCRACLAASLRPCSAGHPVPRSLQDGERIEEGEEVLGVVIAVAVEVIVRIACREPLEEQEEVVGVGGFSDL